MDAWKQYLFESHPEATLRSWAARLHFFRFFRAYGGHANDGDSLDVAFRYRSQPELESILKALGISLMEYAECPPQPVPGVSYRGDEYERFPSLIPGVQWIKQPGHCLIADQKAFVWCERGLVKISVGQSYQVTAADVSSAEAIENLLFGLVAERVDPPFDTEHYICPKYYPDYFS